MGIRDVIAHHYFDLDAEIIHNVVKQNLPDMLVSIDRILHKITPQSSAMYELQVKA